MEQSTLAAFTALWDAPAAEFGASRVWQINCWMY